MFDTNIFFRSFFMRVGGGHTKFLLVPAFRICTSCLPKYEWNLLKIGFKNTYFQVFQGFPAIPASCQNPASSKMANFGQFLAKMGETGIFFKKSAWNIYIIAYKP